MKECEFCGADRMLPDDTCGACGCPRGGYIADTCEARGYACCEGRIPAPASCIVNGKNFKPNLDPCGELAWTVGSDDDFVCFDYDIDPDAKIVYLGSTVNSETGSFIQDFLPDQAVSYADDITAPYEAALALFSAGIDWCIDNEVEYDDADIAEFARAVHAAVTGETP